MRTPNNYLPTAVLGLLFIGALHSCTSDEKPLTQEAPVQLTVLYPSGELSGVKVGTIHPFDFADSVLAVAEPSTGDTATVVLNLSEPTLAYLEVADQAHPIYLTPGDDLNVQVRGTGEDQTIFHTGIGSAVNNYLVQAARIEQQFYDAGGESVWKLKPKEFADRLNSTRAVLDKLQRQYADSAAIPAELSEVLQMRNRLKLDDLKGSYQLIHYLDEPALPVGVDEFLQGTADKGYYEVPTDTSFLGNGLLAYNHAVALRTHLALSVAWPISDSLSQDESQTQRMPLVADSVIRGRRYSPGIEEFLVAQNVSEWLDIRGITPEVDTLFAHFKKNYSSSDLTIHLGAQYQRWLTLSPGRPAPPISGTTPEGEPLSLSDLKGKVVYIDVWATWCGPCLKEFPHSRKLQKQFAGNDQAVFLYVSIDRAEDQEKWKNMIADQELKGVHVRESAESRESPLMKAYLISGIPRYILIDQDGNIVDAEAERPSSGKVEAEINKLIAREG